MRRRGRGVLRRGRLLAAGASVLAALLVVELGARFLVGEVADRGNPYFLPRAFYGWAHNPAKAERIEPSGFIGPLPALAKEPGALRISCLGGSTTASGYPEELRRALGRHLSSPVECINWGVHGWTSAETLANYFLNVQDYESDLVLVLHAWNDVAPRYRDPFRSDYTHWRIPWREPEEGAWDRLLSFSRAWSLVRAAWRGRPSIQDYTISPEGHLGPAGLFRPETAEPFVRNVRTVLSHARLRGAHPVVLTLPCREDWREWKGWSAREQRDYSRVLGARQHNELLRGLAREEGFALIDLAHWARELRRPRVPLPGPDPLRSGGGGAQGAVHR